METQHKIDALKERSLVKDSLHLYPFNPNFITDYKGYTLGLSLAEIDRIHAYRAKNEYVNSSEDFQKVTQISDSLLKIISPYFKFPEWTQKSAQSKVGSKRSKATPKNLIPSQKLEDDVQIKDINAATAEELRVINGIGAVLSERIVKFRNRLGGFLIEEQLYDVYGLAPEVVKKVLLKYKVFNKPVVQKININSASVKEISSLVYIEYSMATEVVSYREENGPFSSLNELKNIEGFPTDKIDRIALYLSF